MAINCLIAGCMLLGLSQASHAQTAAEFELIGQAHMALCRSLKDCATARFQHEVVLATPGGNPVVCGEFNAKNSFGGYTGFEPYIFSRGSLVTRATLGAAVPALFDNAWDRSCR